MPKAIILTALPVEHTAAQAHLSDVHEIVHPQGTIYNLGTFEGQHETWDVALVEIGMGNERAAMETERATAYFAPDVAMFVGVAGGIKDVAIGDVVVATKAYGYEYGKSVTTFIPRPAIGVSSYPLIQRAQQIARDSKWQERIKPFSPKEKPSAIVKPIAAGSKVVASTESDTYELLRANYSDSVAVEMEGYGFLESSHASRNVMSIVVRGISDLLNAKAEADSQGSQVLASQHAAAFSFEMLSKFQPDAISTYHGNATSRLTPPTTMDPPPVGLVFTAATIFGPLPQRVRTFAGRGHELALLEKHLINSSNAIPIPTVVYGIRGIGKSQLLRKYAEIRHSDYDHIIWLLAETQEQLESSLARVALDSQLPGADPANPAKASRIALTWFEQQQRILIVYDNALPDIVMPHLPNVGSCHILISSNDPHWSPITPNHFRLEGLALSDAIEFIVQRTGQNDTATAGRIATAFECLPLALEQAVAYISAAGIDLDSYEQLLAQFRSTLLKERSRFTEYPESVYSAFSLSLDRVAQESEGAVVALIFLAHLNSRSVPRNLANLGMHAFFDHNNIPYSDLTFNHIISQLSNASLIVIHPNTIFIHKLVQTFMMDSLDEEERDAWSRFVLLVLAASFPFDIEDSAAWPECESLIEHIIEAIHNAQYSTWDDDEIGSLYSNAGSYLNARGRYEQANLLLSTVLEYTERTMGGQDPHLALALNNLLNVQNELGNTDYALSLGEKAIAILTSNAEVESNYAIELGKIFSNVGRLYLHGPKNYSLAKRYLNQALQIHQNELGQQHYTTAIDLNNIGTIYRAERHWPQAYAYFQRAVRVHRDVLDPNDYRLAIALFNLGNAAFHLDCFEQAELYLGEAVGINDSLEGGANGWDQLDALKFLARSLMCMHRSRDAAIYFRRAIDLGKALAGEHSQLVVNLGLELGAALLKIGNRGLCAFESNERSPKLTTGVSYTHDDDV